MGRRSTWMAWAMVAVLVACLGLEPPLSVASDDIQHRLGFYLALTLAPEHAEYAYVTRPGSLPGAPPAASRTGTSPAARRPTR